MIVPWIDLAFAAYDAGFRGEAHAISVALAQPESGRNTDAVNSTDPNGGSFGLLQINGVHDPNASGVYPNKVPTTAWIELMKNPLENYKAAFKVWNSAGKSFGPWGAFTSNLHVSSMDAARCALDARQRIVTANSTIANLQATRNSLQESVNSLQGALSASQSNLNAMTQLRDAIADELELVRSDLASAQTQRDVLEVRLVQKNSLIDQARAI